MQEKKVSYTKKGAQLFKNPPFISLDLEWTHLVLCCEALLGTDIFNRILEFYCTRDHEEFGVPASVDRLDHEEWFDLQSGT